MKSASVLLEVNWTKVAPSSGQPAGWFVGWLKLSTTESRLWEKRTATRCGDSDGVTTMVAPSITVTSDLANTVTPSVADKVSSFSLAAASTWAMSADASDVAESISNSRLTALVFPPTSRRRRLTLAAVGGDGEGAT